MGDARVCVFATLYTLRARSFRNRVCYRGFIIDAKISGATLDDETIPLGLSNYSSEQLSAYFAVCEKKGYIKPTVYQGHYSAFFRTHEKVLIPLLRRHGCPYHAFSPLGGGFLSGNATSQHTNAEPSSNSKSVETRWEGASEMRYYMRIFDKPAVHSALPRLKQKLQAYNAKQQSTHSNGDGECVELSLTEISLRWLMHHSVLKKEMGDAVILGAKSVDRLRGNVEFRGKGPLPEEILRAVDDMWDEVKDSIEDE